MPLFSRSKKLSSVTPPSDISTLHFPVTIQVNVSQVGLGAALLQNGKPVTFASKALTKTECWYANIERERCWLPSLEWRDSKHTTMVGLSSSSQTTSPWNPSPRRTWHTCQPTCSACYCTSRAMITPSVTAPVRKWPCLTHSVSSAHILDLTSWWTLPSTKLACPQRGRKHSNKSLWVTLRCMPSQHDHHGLAPTTSRWSLTHYAHTGNIKRPWLLKMASSYVEKPSSSLHQKGRGYYSNSTSSIKKPPKPSCLHMDVSPGWA